MEQGFAHAEKAREQNLVHINQRFDDMNQRFDALKEGISQRFEAVDKRFDDLKEGVNQRFDGVNQRFDTLEKILGWQNRIVMGIFFVILAAAVKYLFFG